MFPKFAWWSIVLMFFLIPAVFVVVASDSIQTYHVALVGYMGAGLVLTSSSVNSLIYYSEGSRQAAAAGFILLSMVNVRLAPFHNPIIAVRPAGTPSANNEVDNLDLLFWFGTIGSGSCLHRLLCSTKGIIHEPTYYARLWWSARNLYIRSTSTNVHICSTQWL